MLLKRDIMKERCFVARGELALSLRAFDNFFTPSTSIRKLQASQTCFNTTSNFKTPPACNFIRRTDELIQPVVSRALTTAPQTLDFSQDNAGPSRFSFQRRSHPNCIYAYNFCCCVIKILDMT